MSLHHVDCDVYQSFIAGHPAGEYGCSAGCAGDLAQYHEVPDPDETWTVTYAYKPTWWDDESEPRCDACGVHCEDANIGARGGWCGECGNCKIHCSCKGIRPLEDIA